MTVRTAAWLALLVFVPLSTASAQFFDQLALADFLNRRAESLSLVPETSYSYYTLASETGNSVYARNNFFMHLGEGQAKKGQELAMLVGLLNRTTMNEVFIGDTLVVPSHFDLDFRAYSPFPRYYAGGSAFDKLFIMDKTLQAFAAYEYGELVRWGIINTGNPEESPTPNGRYNFNWREEFRVSSLSPPGEEWQMYWVVNFHQARGMHIHQYEMPTGGPTSHGCVRLVDADAEWAYYWADTWKTTASGDGFSSGAGRILEQGTTVLVIGTEPEGNPEPFDFYDYGPALKTIDLPVHPYEIPPGTSQQRHFDRRRPAAAIAAKEPPTEEAAPVADALPDDAETVAALVPAPQEQATDDATDAVQTTAEETPPGAEAEQADDALQPLPFVDLPAIEEPFIAAQDQAPSDTTATDAEQPVTDAETLVADDLVADSSLPDAQEQTPEDEQQPEEVLTAVTDTLAADQPEAVVLIADADTLATDQPEEALIADAAPDDVEQPDDAVAPPVEEEVAPQTVLDLRQTSWTIVAASHTTQEAALAEAAKYREQIESNGYFVNVVEMTSGGQTPYRVVVGQFETLAATLKAQEQLGDDIPNNAWQYYLEPIANDVHFIDEAPAALADAAPADAAAPTTDDQPTDDQPTDDQATTDDQSRDEAQALPVAAQQEDAEQEQGEDTLLNRETLAAVDEQAADTTALPIETQPVDDAAQDALTQDSLAVAEALPAQQDSVTVAEAQPGDTEPRPGDTEPRPQDSDSLLVAEAQLEDTPITEEPSANAEPASDLQQPTLEVERPAAQDTLIVADTQTEDEEQQPSDPPTEEAQANVDVAPERVEEEAPEPIRFDQTRRSWTIIVASYIAEIDAEIIAAEYRKQFQDTGYVVDVINAESAGESLYRVVVGQFDTLVASTAAQQELADVIPFDAWLFYVDP